jgi:hypothetical protein
MMKKYLILIAMGMLSLSSCAIHQGLTSNANLNTTQVVLEENNFEVVDQVQGESTAFFVFGIGGITKKAMIAEARADMLRRANIVGSSKAIIHETVEIQHSFFPFVRTYTVTVSGFVVEFKG